MGLVARVAYDRGPGADLPFGDQSARHIGVVGGERSTTSLAGAENNSTPPVHRIGQRTRQQQLAALHWPPRHVSGVHREIAARRSRTSGT